MRCDRCLGKGYLKCSSCKGKGYYTAEVEGTFNIGEYRAGARYNRVSCPVKSCEAGRVTCRNCKGTGEHKKRYYKHYETSRAISDDES